MTSPGPSTPAPRPPLRERTADPLVRVQNVAMAFPTDDGVVEAIADISGEVGRGRFVSLIGPSGCGKSTLLELIAGLLTPTSGRVMVDGHPVTGPRRDTAMVFQEDSTLHWRTVKQNIAFGLEVAGVDRRERERRVAAMIDLVGLSGFGDRRPRQLSGGMKQRVAIARALAVEPGLLLMDEPFGALDQQTRMLIGQELQRIWAETSSSVVFVTHDIQEAVYLSDEVWVLSRRPARIKQMLPIDLPRPRHQGVMSENVFHEYTVGLWDLLRDEARHAFATEAEAG